jgi:ABC-type transport system involved in multi-copper enzyme maturation permease subunit
MNRPIYTSLSQLPLRQRLQVAFEILRAQAQILFSKKFIWFVLGVLAQFVIVYVINYRQELNERLVQENVVPLMLYFPLVVIAIFMNMQLISSEKDNRTLEILFTTAGSRYKVWLLRLATVNLVLLAMAFMQSILTYFGITDIEILATALNGFVTPFSVGALTFFLSVRLRSGFGAAMLTALLVVLCFMFTELLEDTRYLLFFNPYNIPRRIDPETWNLWMWQNRMTLLVAGLALQFFGLRGLENRERLLR